LRAIADCNPAPLFTTPTAEPQPNFYFDRKSLAWQGDWRTVSGEAYVECCFHTDWNR